MGFIPEMKEFKNIGVALLPIGDNEFTMNLDEVIAQMFHYNNLKSDY